MRLAVEEWTATVQRAQLSWTHAAHSSKNFKICPWNAQDVDIHARGERGHAVPGESGGGGATRVLSLGTLTLSRAPVLMNCSLSTG